MIDAAPLACPWEALLDPANLRLAWRRARRFFAETALFVDQLAIGRFGADLDANLQSIANDFASGRYRLTRAQPAFWPKPTGGRAIAPDLRTIHWIEPRDQVAWLAVMNVIGGDLDAMLPDWSYGHRLQHGPGARRLETDGQPAPDDQYLWPPSQSWPLLQRHVLLTARAILRGGIDVDRLSPDERRAWDAEQARPPAYRLAWLRSEGEAERIGSDELHASLFDLENYTLNIGIDATRLALRRFSSAANNDSRFAALLDALLDFRSYDPDTDSTVPLDHVPVGLAVQGPLNNVAMLMVDRVVEGVLRERGIAHFRFVDDHVVLARSAGELVDWLEEYENILRGTLPGLAIKRSKLRPAGLAAMLGSKQKRGGVAVPDPDTRFDPDRPQPIWSLAAFRPPPPVEGRVCPWGLKITPVEAGMLIGTIADPPPVTEGIPPLAWPPASAEEDARFSAGLEMIRRFRDRRGLLCGAVRHAAKTGYPALGPLCDDLMGLAKLSPPTAQAGAVSLLQQLAIVVPALVLRARSTPLHAEREASLGFFQDLAKVLRLQGLGRDSWALARAWSNFSAAVAVARGLAIMPPSDAVMEGIVPILDALPRAREMDAVVTWLAWFRDFDPVEGMGAERSRPGAA